MPKLPPPLPPNVQEGGTDYEFRMLPEWMRGTLTLSHLIAVCDSLPQVQITRERKTVDGTTTKNEGNHYSDFEADLIPAEQVVIPGAKKAGGRYITLGISTFKVVPRGCHL